MSRSTLRCAVIALVGLLVTPGCDGSDSLRETGAVRRTSAPADRVFEGQLNEPALNIGNEDGPNQLMMPRLVASSRDGVFVFDYGDMAVKAFSYTGVPIWTHGRRGTGPGEFMNPFDIEVVAGSVWILDQSAGRVTILSGDTGTYLGEVPLGGRTYRDILPRPDHSVLALVVGPGTEFVHLIHPNGKVDVAARFPTADLERAPFLLRQPMAAIQAGTGGSPGVVRWAVGFPYSAEIASYRDTTLLCVGEMVNAKHWEEQSQERPTASAVDLAFSGESIVVLAADSGALRLRVADGYDPNTCEYIQSIRLPFPSIGLEVTADHYVLLRQDPVPGLTIFDRQPGRFP